MNDLISRNEMLRSYQELCMNIACSECSFYFGDTLTGDCLLEKWIHSLPSAEPKTPSNGSITCVKSEKMHVRTMDDCISRRAAIDAIRNTFVGAIADTIEIRLNDLPSAEPEIIRCKDCKHFEYDHIENVNGIPLIVAHEICMRWCDGTKTSENGYCFLAERKEE